MSPVTTVELADARRVAAAAVRIGPAGASVRMPRLGSVRHGSVEAALRGCPCQPCDRIRDGLLVDQVMQVLNDGLLVDQVLDEVQDRDTASMVEIAPASPLEAADPPYVAADGVVHQDRDVADLPAGLVADLPADTTATAGLAARFVVQRHANDDTDCVHLLLMLGLAAELDADAGPGEDIPLEDAAASLDADAAGDPDLVDPDHGAPDLVDLVAGGPRGAAA